MNPWRVMIPAVLLLFSAHGVSHGIDNNFVIAFNNGENGRFDLCITKELPSGTRGVILDLKNGYTCDVKVLDSLEYGPIEPLPISRIDYKMCKTFKKHSSKSIDYIFYYGGPVSQYGLMKPNYIKNKAFIDKVDKLIRGGRFLTNDFDKYFEGTLSKKPIVYAPVPSLQDILIAQYVTSAPYTNPSDKYGPMFSYIGGKVRKLADEAVFETTFYLNDRFFALYYNGCWAGCGDISYTLIEVTQDGIIEIFADGLFAT